MLLLPQMLSLRARARGEQDLSKLISAALSVDEEDMPCRQVEIALGIGHAVLFTNRPKEKRTNSLARLRPSPSRLASRPAHFLVMRRNLRRQIPYCHLEHGMASPVSSSPTITLSFALAAVCSRAKAPVLCVM